MSGKASGKANVADAKNADAKNADAKNADAKNADAEKTAEKPAVVKPEIIRGRMPLPIVHMIKFAPAGETDGALAAKFRTTNGKVNDIRKESNFGYVKEDYVPVEAMIVKATEYADQLDDKSILKTVKGLKPASAEQAAAFDAIRKASRPVKAAKPAADPKEAAKTNAQAKTDEAKEKGKTVSVSDADLKDLTA